MGVLRVRILTYIREPGRSVRRPWKFMSQLFFLHVAERGVSDLPLLEMPSPHHDWIFTYAWDGCFLFVSQD